MSPDFVFIFKRSLVSINFFTLAIMYSLVSARSVLPELVPEGGAVLDAEDAGAEGARELDAGGGAGGGAALCHAGDGRGAGDAEHAVGVAEEAAGGAVALVT